jgi:hypothetical protein
VFAVKHSNDILIYFTPKRGKAPDRLGEAIRSLEENYEDWALRSSLILSVARPL